MTLTNRFLFLYVETPLHAGSGRGMGSVDLPIQRERLTDYPLLQASGLKGGLRAAAREQLTPDEWEMLFGPENDPSLHAGALAFGDARLLLFPVRSLAGVFAFTTSVDVLARFRRTAEILGVKLNWEMPNPPKDDETACVAGDALVVGEQDKEVVLEEFSFKPDTDQADRLRKIGEEISNYLALPADGYDYWRTALTTKLCLLPETAFRDFARYATEVQTHVRLDPKTKTVANKALFTSESLPTDTVLYAPLISSRSRREKLDLDTAGVLKKFTGLDLTHVQLGGDETTGQGIVHLNVQGG